MFLVFVGLATGELELPDQARDLRQGNLIEGAISPPTNLNGGRVDRSVNPQ